MCVGKLGGAWERGQYILSLITLITFIMIYFELLAWLLQIAYIALSCGYTLSPYNIITLLIVMSCLLGFSKTYYLWWRNHYNEATTSPCAETKCAKKKGLVFWVTFHHMGQGWLLIGELESDCKMWSALPRDHAVSDVKYNYNIMHRPCPNDKACCSNYQTIYD